MLVSTVPTAHVTANTPNKATKMLIGFLYAAKKGYSYMTTTSASRASSTTFHALSFSSVRPSVSMNVLCSDSSDEIVGSPVPPTASHLTFSAPSGRTMRRMRRSYWMPSGILGPSMRGTDRAYVPLGVLSLRRTEDKALFQPMRKLY